MIMAQFNHNHNLWLINNKSFTTAEWVKNKSIFILLNSLLKCHIQIELWSDMKQNY